MTAMQVAEYYVQIPGIESPWEIADVRLDRASSVVTVELAHADGLRRKRS